MTHLHHRLIVFNVCGFAALYWAWGLGYVQRVLYGDSTYMSYAIAALFAVGLVSTAWRSFHVADGDAAIRNEHIGDIANWLMTIGLLGTVVGFFMALMGMDPSSLTSADGVRDAAARVLAGMGVAIGTTIVGGVFGLWTDVNRRMLDTATALANQP